MALGFRGNVDKEKHFCMKHLEALRNVWLLKIDYDSIPNGFVDLSGSEVRIDGLLYREKVYVESADEGKIVVFHVSRKSGLITSTHYCLGVLVSKEKQKLLSNEELWELGIP